MRDVEVKIKGTSDYSQSRYYLTDEGCDKLKGESHSAYEARTWKHKLHTDEDGNVFIPSASFKFAIEEISKHKKEKIKGKGNSTWSKYFVCGVSVEGNSLLKDKQDNPINSKDVKGQWFHVPSDGMRCGSKRVAKCFPVIPVGWTATVKFVLIDDEIPTSLLIEYLEAAGMLTGIGRYRPSKSGDKGRFEVTSFKETKRPTSKKAA